MSKTYKVWSDDLGTPEEEACIMEQGAFFHPEDAATRFVEDIECDEQCYKVGGEGMHVDVFVEHTCPTRGLVLNTIKVYGELIPTYYGYKVK